jgi:NarL family two-component system sensor histidine kinase YdfH
MRGLLNIETYRKLIWDTPEKELSHYRQAIGPIRWFILVWVGMVSLWGSAQLLLGDYMRFPFAGGFLIGFFSTKLMAPPPSPDQVSSLVKNTLPYSLRLDHISYPLGVIGVLLLAIQLCLHWLCLSGRLPRRWAWCYFLLQGGCVLTLSFMWSDMIIALGFYLVLVIETFNMLKQVQQIVGFAATYLGFFILTLIWQVTQMAIWMTVESVLLLVIFLIGWIILSIQQVHARSKLEAAHLQLAAYAMRLEELTLVNERQRLARELHDTLAQNLVGLTLQLERVDLHLEKQRFERARELVQQAMSRARATLADARSAIDDLRATTLGPDDLLLAVQREINRFTEATAIGCVADIAALSAMPEHLCEHVLRAITEGLTNVARHSQAHQVWICAHLQETMFTVEVRDDGRGFESTAIGSQKGHYGLLGLRERARLCGGQLDMESAVGKGTVLRLHLPVHTRGGLE